MELQKAHAKGTRELVKNQGEDHGEDRGDFASQLNARLPEREKK